MKDLIAVQLELYYVNACISGYLLSFETLRIAALFVQGS
jgi:hypothetical protein